MGNLAISQSDSQSNLDAFGLKKETGVPGENPRRHRENMQTTVLKASNLEPKTFLL